MVGPHGDVGNAVSYKTVLNPSKTRPGENCNKPNLEVSSKEIRIKRSLSLAFLSKSMFPLPLHPDRPLF